MENGNGMATDAGSGAPATSSRPSSPANTYPLNMTSTLQHIVGQLEIITRTLSVLEERISINEERIGDLAKVQKELLVQRQQQQQQQRRTS
jgi:centriolar protein POC1